MCDTVWHHLVKATEVIAGLAESNGSLLPGGWLESPVGWLPVHQDQLCAQRSVTSMVKHYLYLFLLIFETLLKICICKKLTIYFYSKLLYRDVKCAVVKYQPTHQQSYNISILCVFFKFVPWMYSSVVDHVWVLSVMKGYCCIRTLLLRHYDADGMIVYSQPQPLLIVHTLCILLLSDLNSSMNIQSLITVMLNKAEAIVTRLTPKFWSSGHSGKWPWGLNT